MKRKTWIPALILLNRTKSTIQRVLQRNKNTTSRYKETTTQNIDFNDLPEDIRKALLASTTVDNNKH